MIAASFGKSLQIILARNIHGKTFWEALSDAISPRIPASTTVDEIALSIFRSVFLDRPLKKGTFIILTWLNPSKLLVSLLSYFSCDIFFKQIRSYIYLFFLHFTFCCLKCSN